MFVALLAVLAAAAFGPHGPRIALAALSGSKSCSGPDGGSTANVGDTVTCTLTITAETAPPDIPAGTTIVITAQDNNYIFTAATCTATGGSCTILSVGGTAITAACGTATCSGVTFNETLTITSLNRERISQLVTVSTAVASIRVTDPTFRLVAADTLVFVSTTGRDENNCQSRALACRTIGRALQAADNGDSVLLVGGTYDIERTVLVDKLVTIQPDGQEKVILKARPGVTIFQVGAPGGQLLHVTIRNLTMGGNYQDGRTEPVIRLNGDSYTEIANNIIGGLELPINNGIVIANSLRPHIHDNTFIGSTQVIFTPYLVVGRTVTGFGVISLECFGVASVSVTSEVILTNNSFTNLWTSGIWLCSDGGGSHKLENNVFRNYWRGIALKDVTDSKVSGNNLVGGQGDGIIVYGASVSVTVENNRIESNLGLDAAGLRIGWAADPLLPLNNSITGNRILRATIALHVYGAQTTMITNNTINVTGSRTGVLVSTAVRPNGPETQPINTEITGNLIVSDGPCAAGFGCALRLLGVTVPVLAINNDWGQRTVQQVEQTIWHQYDDPVLGLVTFVPFRNQSSTPSATPLPTLPASPLPTPLPTPPSSSTGVATR